MEINEDYMKERFNQFEELRREHSEKWLNEFCEDIKDRTYFWDMSFTEYTLFRIFQEAFSEMIEEFYQGFKEELDGDMDREDISRELYRRTIKDGLDKDINNFEMQGGIS